MSNAISLTQSQRFSLDALMVALSKMSTDLEPALQTRLNELGRTLGDELQDAASLQDTINELVFVVLGDATLGPLYAPIRDRFSDPYHAQPRKAIIVFQDDPQIPEALQNTIQSGDRLKLATAILTAPSSPALAQATRTAIQQSLPPSPDDDDDDDSWLGGFGA